MQKVFHRYSVTDFLTIIKSSEIRTNNAAEYASLCEPKVALANKHY